MSKVVEKVELVTGQTYWSDDHWVTVWRGKRKVGGDEADRIRYIATVQHGGGRNDRRRHTAG